MFNLREATETDAALISRIIARSWHGTYQELIDPVYLARLPEAYWLASMRSWLGSGRMYGLIAERDGLPVGCIIYGRGRDEAYGDWGEIVSLYLLPEVLHQGIGSALLAAALSGLREDGFSRVYLWAIRGNVRAESFYRHHGFIGTGEQVQYRIGSQEMTDIRMIREG